MIFDLNQTAAPADSDNYDICVAGGGVAGITLAIELASRGRRVALLEGGGFELTEDSQQVYRGPVLGRSYFSLDEARLRFLGGSSNHWAGWCRPLDAHDFKARSYIPHSGWPIEKQELDRYLAAASEILEIPHDYSDRGVEKSNNNLKRIEFHVSAPVNFRDKYEAELRSSDKIDVFLNANLVDIGVDTAAGRVSALQCANYVDTDQLHAFRASAFVLALGGIENPRLLLNCRKDFPAGIGNDKGLVGRFFMEHFHVHVGYYVANQATWPFGEEEVFLAPSSTFMDDERIASAGLWVIPAPGEKETSLLDDGKAFAKGLLCANDVIRDFARSIQTFRCLPPFDNAGTLRVMSEQVPNWQSQVRLAGDTDRFGLRRAGLDWQIADIDWRTIKVMTVAFGKYLASHDYGNVKLADWLLDESRFVPGVTQDEWLGAGWHHMGTTRMAATPEDGVVDTNCRIFGIDNLYMAGSSVFPTAGHANPTLTIVQLVLRLSDHLDTALAGN